MISDIGEVSGELEETEESVTATCSALEASITTVLSSEAVLDVKLK